MKRRFRLTGSTDFQRVRRSGKSTAHPLIVMIALPNQAENSRFGIVAGRAIGNALQRNRAKRHLREALRPLLPMIAPGWDVLLLARAPIVAAAFPELQQALRQLLQRAHLFAPSHEE